MEVTPIPQGFNQNQQTSFAAPIAQPREAVAPRQAVPQAPASQDARSKEDYSSSDGRREALVQRAAEAIRNSFPGAGRTFTIFKDANGQLITRFTSSDGRVTYVPEPNVIEFMQRHGSMPDQLLKINA